MIAVTITDPRESAMPNVGLMELEDAETGNRFSVDTSKKGARDLYASNFKNMVSARTRLFGSINMDHIDIGTERPYIEEFVRFFRMRERRI